MNALTTTQTNLDNAAPLNDAGDLRADGAAGPPASRSLPLSRIGQVMPQAHSRAQPVAGIVAGLLFGGCAAALLFGLTGAMVAAPLAWAFGWLYLVWAQEASRIPALVVDGSLAMLTLGAGVLAAQHPALPIGLFALHALVWPLRAWVDGSDARMRPLAAVWMSFHASMALLLL